MAGDHQFGGSKPFGKVQRLKEYLNSLWWSPLPIVLVVLLGVLITDLAFREVTGWEEQKAQNAFREASRDRILVIQREITLTLAMVEDIAAFFDASKNIGRREFREFLGPVLKRYEAIQALQWVPRVPAEERADFVTEAKRGFYRFEITERDDNGELTSATSRPEHFPVLYIQPYKQNKELLGFDLASSPSMMQVLDGVRAAGEMRVSPFISLETGSGVPSRFMAFMPVYHRERESREVVNIDLEDPDDFIFHTPQIRELRGFAIGVFNVADVVERALGHLVPIGIDLQFYDVTGEEEQTLLYVHASRFQSKNFDVIAPHDEVARSSRELIETLDVGNRKWKVVCTPLPGRFLAGSWSGWIILFGGFSFTILLVIYLFTLLGRARQVRHLVSERTEQLLSAVNALNNEVNERKHAEQALQRLNESLEHHVSVRTDEAERRAAELEQFAYVASHDLKAPLRAISNLAGWLQEDLEHKLTSETREQLNLMQDRVNRMQALIEGLLDYSRIGRMGLEISPVDVAALLEETIDSLSPPPEFSITIGPGMPVFHTDRLQLGQVFANLIGNSIKHHPSEKGRIWIDVEEEGEFYAFSVTDDGLGIAPEYHAKIFMMFQALEVKDMGANTGIGLALVKKIVQEHGGAIKIDSEVGKGACFRFTWPKKLES